MIRATARRATAADLPFILATERLPGYDRTVGSFPEAEHLLHLADPDWLYLVSDGCGFAILQDINNETGNVQLRRLAVAERSRGLGSVFLPAVIGHVFQHTAVHRLWLHFVDGNEPALKLYENCGLVREGIEREAGRRPDGSRFDFITMSILRPEWEARS